MSETRPAHPDPLTVSAVAVVAYIVANVIHEGLGHGGACLLVGGKPLLLTTAHFDWDASMVSSDAVRFVAAGGTIANLLAALMFGWAFRTRPGAAPVTRYFMWISMSVNYFVAAGYPLFSGVSGVGDWVEVIRGWEPGIVWRITITLIGAVSYFWGVLVILRMLNPLLGSSLTGRMLRGTRLTLHPYIVGCVTSTLGAALNPVGFGMVLTSAAAHFGGTSALAWMTQMLRGPRISESTEPAIEIPRSVAWITSAVVLLLLHVAVLGPGVTFQR